MSDQAYNSNFNDDFEKVDPDNYGAPDQDENITSSSMPGDMAEEDRYQTNEQDLLGDFSVGGSMPISDRGSDVTPQGQPLISFGDNSPESSVTASAPSPPKPQPTEFKPEPKPEPMLATPTEGCWMKTVDPRVLDIIYWRDLKTTGVVFGSMMFVLLSLSCCSLLSVLAYLSLAILTVTFSFRVYKSVMQAVQKTNDGHPFKKLLDLEIRLSDDVVQAAAQKIADNMNNCCAELRRLYLVGDYIDSLKFGLLLWLLTYVGAWFNGMTLIILVVVSIFTIPKVYETYQGPIDQNVNLVRAQLNKIMAQISAKIPFPKKKAKTQ